MEIHFPISQPAADSLFGLCCTRFSCSFSRRQHSVTWWCWNNLLNMRYDIKPLTRKAWDGLQFFMLSKTPLGPVLEGPGDEMSKLEECGVDKMAVTMLTKHHTLALDCPRLFPQMSNRDKALKIITMENWACQNCALYIFSFLFNSR